MKEIIKKSPILPWAIVFILANLIFRENGATNEMSRFATMRAMSDHLSFQINDYKHWTIDWAIKDGKNFSNKAPGLRLLGFPVFFVLDQFSKFGKKDKVNENGSRIKMVTSTPRVIISLLYQVLPYAFLILLIVNWMQKKSSIPLFYIHFFALAALFGNSAAIFMNFFFGHAMSALFVLALSYYLYKEDYFKVGLFFGLSLLTEYTAALLFPSLLMALAFQPKGFKKKSLYLIMKGSRFPGALWCFYHGQTVGSVFKIPAQFQNPIWVEKSTQVKKLWGMFAIPDPHLFFKLLFGLERGILWTQPWVFFSWAIGFQVLAKKKENEQQKSLPIFVLLGTLLLLLMNSAFNGWHGGSTSGPRYLSMMFPASALLIALYHHQIKTKIFQYLLVLSLGFSLVFRILVYGSRALAPENHNLWPWLFQDLLNKPGLKGELRAFTLLALLLVAGIYLYKSKNRNRSYSKE